MPQATDVEQAVLGALMIDRDAYDRVKHYLSKETFYEPRNQLVFEAIKYLAEKEKAVDVLTVTERLKDENNLEEVGGAVYVAELSSKVASSANIEYHSEIIVKRQLQRFAIKVAQATEDKAHDNTLVIEEELATRYWFQEAGVIVRLRYDEQLKTALGNAGLEEIKAMDEEFDPNVHNAVMTETIEEKEDGTITKVLQKGYKLKDKVVRPSMVAVNKK